jgi:catechol 2,3-dioxygenase-like lactoylglutathione lyase family enzyme
MTIKPHGIHHVTAIAGDPQRNVDFFTTVLRLRLVKQTVNFVAKTFAPVPSFARYTNVAELHPYPWLRQPDTGSVRSFSAWRR